MGLLIACLMFLALLPAPAPVAAGQGPAPDGKAGPPPAPVVVAPVVARQAFGPLRPRRINKIEVLL